MGWELREGPPTSICYGDLSDRIGTRNGSVGQVDDLSSPPAVNLHDRCCQYALYC